MRFQEAINSMFRTGTAVRLDAMFTCRIFRSLAPSKTPDSQSPHGNQLFALADGFRGWTLQELLAPVSVEFFTREGWRLGDKRSLEQQIHKITGIDILGSQGTPLSQFEVDERFKWAETRRTTREEDWAYCLLGIFDIYIPLIYGEGRENAIRRLRKEIYEARKLPRKLIICILRSPGDKRLPISFIFCTNCIHVPGMSDQSGSPATSQRQLAAGYTRRRIDRLSDTGDFDQAQETTRAVNSNPDHVGSLKLNPLAEHRDVLYLQNLQ